MTTWTCPTCDSVMSVTRHEIGITKPCAKCGELGIVTDDFAVASDQGRVQQHAHLMAAVNIPNEWHISILLMRIGLCLVFIIGCLEFINAFVNALSGRLVFFNSSVIQMGLGLCGYAVTTVAIEVYRIRRYQEESAKRS
jgi:hypothetical protein